MAGSILKILAAAGSLIIAGAGIAQTAASPGTACPAGTHYATIRHNMIKPGQWATFEQAVAAHNAWYAGHQDKTRTNLLRVIGRSANRPVLSTTEAVTITNYSGKPQPPRDAGLTAFTAKYRASSEMKDEARICMP